MRRTFGLRIASIVTASILIGGVGSARAETIDFDGIANSTVINNLYAALGVTFFCSDGAYAGTCNVDLDGANVYARSSSINNSPGNVVSTLGAGVPGNRVNLTGVIQADFATAQDSVSIDAFVLLSPEGFGTPGQGFLSAFNGTTFLGSSLTTGSEAWETLTVGGFAQQITSVRFSQTVGGYPSSALFDNLSFAVGGCGEACTTVPEPSSLLMLVSGVFALAGAARMKRQSA